MRSVFFAFVLAAWAAPSARRLDSSVLEAPIETKDPLVVLKHLWHRGARGEVFEIDPQHALDCGVYLAVENWSILRAEPVPGITFMHDDLLLSRIKESSARGIRTIVDARVPNGGFAVNTDNTFYKIVARRVPSLSHGPYVGVNGFTTLYLWDHELEHHADHVSGFSDRLWRQIRRTLRQFRGPYELEPIYFFISEARAFAAELAELDREDRALEFSGSPESSESTEIKLVDGPSFREHRRKMLPRLFNETYPAALRHYSPELRRAARGFFKRYIPEFSVRFDAWDRMRPSPER